MYLYSQNNFIESTETVIPTLENRIDGKIISIDAVDGADRLSYKITCEFDRDSLTNADTTTAIMLTIKEYNFYYPFINFNIDSGTYTYSDGDYIVANITNASENLSLDINITDIFSNNSDKKISNNNLVLGESYKLKIFVNDSETPIYDEDVIATNTLNEEILLATATFPQYTVSGSNSAIFDYYLYF